MSEKPTKIAGAKHPRLLKNFLLQPFLQVQLGLYTILLAFGFTLVLIWIIYTSFSRIYDLILELTDTNVHKSASDVILDLRSLVH